MSQLAATRRTCTFCMALTVVAKRFLRTLLKQPDLCNLRDTRKKRARARIRRKNRCGRPNGVVLTRGNSRGYIHLAVVYVWEANDAYRGVQRPLFLRGKLSAKGRL